MWRYRPTEAIYSCSESIRFRDRFARSTEQLFRNKAGEIKYSYMLNSSSEVGVLGVPHVAVVAEVLLPAAIGDLVPERWLGGQSVEQTLPIPVAGCFSSVGVRSLWPVSHVHCYVIGKINIWITGCLCNVFCGISCRRHPTFTRPKVLCSPSERYAF